MSQSLCAEEADEDLARARSVFIIDVTSTEQHKKSTCTSVRVGGAGLPVLDLRSFM